MMAGLKSEEERGRLFGRSFEGVEHKADEKDQWQSDCTGKCAMAETAHSAGTVESNVFMLICEGRYDGGHFWAK